MTTAMITDVSVDDASLDVLVQQASVPNLADLFRKAKVSGAIQPLTVYGEGAKGA